MTEPDGLTRQLEQLVLRELPSRGTDEILASARAVSERLIRQLAQLIGEAGARALHERSIALTKRQHPWFDATPAQHAGQAMQAQVRPDPERALQASVAWLRLYVGLLETFIGERLTLRILNAVWPDLFLLLGKKDST